MNMNSSVKGMLEIGIQEALDRYHRRECVFLIGNKDVRLATSLQDINQHFRMFGEFGIEVQPYY